MALIVKDRVLETCSTSGLVDFTLTGAVTGYQRFSAIGNGNTTYYAAYVIGSNDWEVGIGTVGTSSLTRDTILSSSTGSKVNFAGNPVVWCDLPSSKAIFGDANNNISVNSIFEGFTSVGASGTQIVLTAASTPYYLVTGSGGQTIKLPDATTLPVGAVFDFNNNQSSGAITVNNNSNTLVASIPSGGYTSVILTANSNAAGSWDRHDQAPSNVSWSTNTFDYPGSITSATWNGSTVAYNRGGTGQSSNFVAGGVVYGSSTTALAVTAVGTTGQALLSNGASAPTWGNPTASAGGSTTQVQYNSSGALAGSANMTFNGTTLTLANDASINSVKVGRGGGNLSNNTAIGSNAINATATGDNNTGVGSFALRDNTSGVSNAALGYAVLIQNTSGSYNVGIGSQALFSNSSGGSNFGIGFQSLYNNTTGSYNQSLGRGTLYSNTIGDNNVAFGSNNLSNNTTSSNLTAIGHNALQSNTTNVATLGTITGGSGYTNGTYTAVAMTPVSGATFITYPTVTVVVSGNAVSSVTLVTNGVGASSVAATVLTVAAALIGGTGSGFSIPVATFASGSNNTAVGYQAGYLNTTGTVVAIGYQALYNNTTGAANTAIGYTALTTNTTGIRNVAIGYQSVLQNTTGNANIALGFQSLYANTTGNSNIAIGSSYANLGSLNLNTTGSYNVGVSEGTLGSNTTGSNNTAVGYQALFAVTTSNNNTAYGYQAGNTITTGANNTVIGASAQASSATVSNEITIGNSTQTVVRFPLSYSTVASLPSASTVGRGSRTFVTDALAPTFQTTVTGGGAVFTPVYSDGTNWKVG
jgi:hypothetical protein